MNAKDVAAFLTQLGSHTIPPRFFLLQAWPITLEIEAASNGSITHTVLAPRGRAVAVLSTLKAALPGVRVEVLTDVEVSPTFRAGIELRLTAALRRLMTNARP